MYVCKMSCYWAPHVNYVYEPPPGPGTKRNMYSIKQLHTFCRGTDMERHRRQGDRERRMDARQQETYVRRSQRLGGKSQQHDQETEEHK